MIFRFACFDLDGAGLGHEAGRHVGKIDTRGLLAVSFRLIVTAPAATGDPHHEQHTCCKGHKDPLG